MADPQNFTLHIDPEECIGLSLDTINQNFLNLDVGVSKLSSASLGWVNSNSSIITQAYTWVGNTSVETEIVQTWFTLNSGLNYNVSNWVSQHSATTDQSVTLFENISSSTINTNTWVKRNSSALVQIIDTRTYTKNSRNSIYPVTVVYRKNYVAGTANYSGLLAGLDNWLHGDYSVLVGGTTNTLSADKSVLVGGFGSTVKGESNTVVGGVAHNVSGVDNFIGGGNTNTIDFKCNVIGGGLRNTILNDYCGILGGINNKALHSNTFILGSNITTVIPNATYVNSLVIKDTPPVDNGTGSLLLRDHNGVIRTRLVPNLTNVESLYSWVKVNSGSFISTAAIQSISSALADISTTVQLNSSLWISASNIEQTNLPLSGGAMYGPISFGSSYGPSIDQGMYDNSRGGMSGISLVCSVNYDLNWQAGWLTVLQQDRITPMPLYIDSGAGTSVKIWKDGTVGAGGSGVEITHEGITLPANGYIKDSNSNTWVFIEGNLVLPENGNILNSNHESVLLKKYTVEFSSSLPSNEPLTYVFEHNLGTRYVMTQCYDTNTGIDMPVVTTRLNNLSASVYFPGNAVTNNYTLIFIG